MVVWAAGIGSLVVLDIWCDRNDVVGDSLSECIRVIYRPHTPLGRCALVGSWVALSKWLLPHLWRTDLGEYEEHLKAFS